MRTIKVKIKSIQGKSWSNQWNNLINWQFLGKFANKAERIYPLSANSDFLAKIEKYTERDIIDNNAKVAENAKIANIPANAKMSPIAKIVKIT